MTDLSRARAEQLDGVDPLRHLPEAFVRPDPGLVYLDGNSLGRLPRRTLERVERFTREEWGADLVRGWSRWQDLPLQVGDRVGEVLLGAASGQVVVTDTISVNLFSLAHAACDLASGRSVVVGDSRGFPTDRHVVEGVALARGLSMRWVDSDPVLGVTSDRLAQVLDDEVALVSLAHVDYRSGAMVDLAAVTRQVHDAGAVVLWDLAHSTGCVEVALDAADVDLAVGCTYKYVNAGPGSPGFVYVNRRLHDRVTSPIRGWWSTPDPFAMDAPYLPAAGVARFRTGSPSVVGTLAVDEGVAVLADVGVRALRQRSVALVSYLVELADALLVPLGFELRSPRAAQRRGGHVAFSHPDAEAVVSALAQRARVVADARPPDLVRLSPAPASTTFVEVWEGVTRIAELVSAGPWDRAPGR